MSNLVMLTLMGPGVMAADCLRLVIFATLWEYMNLPPVLALTGLV